MLLKKYKLEITYDGSNFCGWQQQPDVPTVQERLVQSFFYLFRQKISILGASRTDAGVHAKGQVALVSCADFGVPANRLLELWNNVLPQDIIINKLQEISADFHPHLKVLSKEYRYNLFTEKPDPFIAKFGWHYKMISHIDLKAFATYINQFLGYHNFSRFCKTDPTEQKNPWRKLDSINVDYLEDQCTIRISFKAKGFLRYQIRRMVGSAIQYAQNPTKFSLFDTKQALKGIDTSADLIPNFCADGQGLTLIKITYEE